MLLGPGVLAQDQVSSVIGDSKIFLADIAQPHILPSAGQPPSQLVSLQYHKPRFVSLELKVAPSFHNIKRSSVH